MKQVLRNGLAVKACPSKQEDLSLDPQNLCKLSVTYSWFQPQELRTTLGLNERHCFKENDIKAKKDNSWH